LIFRGTWGRAGCERFTSFIERRERPTVGLLFAQYGSPLARKTFILSSISYADGSQKSSHDFLPSHPSASDTPGHSPAESRPISVARVRKQEWPPRLGTRTDSACNTITLGKEDVGSGEREGVLPGKRVARSTQRFQALVAGCAHFHTVMFSFPYRPFPSSTQGCLRPSPGNLPGLGGWRGGGRGKGVEKQHRKPCGSTRPLKVRQEGDDKEGKEEDRWDA